MYNPYAVPPAYGRPPAYPGFPGQPGTPPVMGAPPGLAPPPGMAAAPGTAPPAGMAAAAAPQPVGARGLPPNFQPPANMPNINFTAPVIRLGTTGPSSKPTTPLTGGPGRKDSAVDGPGAAGGRPGVGAGGMEQQRQALRESMMALVPPTKEELVRTVFVGGITEGVGGDDGVERILQTAGPLRKWSRATDADNKPCRFGFAEFDDIEGLGVAVEVLKDIFVPVNQRSPRTADQDPVPEEDIEKSKLLIIIDEESLNYLEEHQATNGPPDANALQARLDTARENLANVLNELSHPTVPVQANDTAVDGNGDTVMRNGETKPDGTQAEVVTIPLTIEDELADIPPEMRETVAAEIAAFRDRSNRRDMERLKREEELEAIERNRGSRVNRLASPPPGAPSGPAGGANGIPVGPRDRGVHGAPLGPKGLQGAQIPRDYQKGVSFINGSGVNGAADAGWINRDDEDSDASDEELERRREEKRQTELEKQYLDQERRWLNRERSRTAAVEREKTRDKDEEAHQQVEKDAMAKRLREWNDDEEATRKTEEYYSDRGTWIRNRAAFRTRESELDERDRAAEERERARDSEKREHARGMADQFLARQAEELEERSQSQQQNRREPQRFKLSLGAAAQKAQQASQTRRSAAEVEGLLEDEEEAGATTKRTLIPITFDSAAEAAGLSEEERAQAVRQLAAEIPTSKEGLWSWPVKWEFVDESVLTEQLRPFVEKKIVEYLGVQEQMLVEVVEEHIRKRAGPQELVEQLEGPLDEEADALVKKLWRMIIFFSESEKRGLSA